MSTSSPRESIASKRSSSHSIAAQRPQRLQKAGLPIEEFAQSTPNLTAATQCLFHLIESQSLIAYPDPQIRLAMSRAVAIEGPRGWRLGKERSAFKIDVVVAMSMAAFAAVKCQDETTFDRSWNWVLYDDANPPPTTKKSEAEAESRRNAEWRHQRLLNYMASGGRFR